MANYGTELNSVKLAGILSKVVRATVSAGDGSTKVFQLLDEDGEESKSIIDGSQTIWVDTTAQTETTHYSIDNDTGRITFVTAPTSEQTVYASFFHIHDTKILTSDLTRWQNRANNWITLNTGLKFDDNSGSYYEHTHHCDGNNSDLLFLPRIPVNSITSVQFLDSTTGDVNETLTANEDYIFRGQMDSHIGRLVSPAGFPAGRDNIKIVYKHGISSSTTDIKEIAWKQTAIDLEETICALMLLAHSKGASFDEFTRVVTADSEFQMGEQWVNLEQAEKSLLQGLLGSAKDLYKMLPKEPQVQFSTGTVSNIGSNTVLSTPLF